MREKKDVEESRGRGGPSSLWRLLMDGNTEGCLSTAECRREGLNQAGRAMLAPPAAVDAHSCFMRMKAEGFYYKCF